MRELKQKIKNSIPQKIRSKLQYYRPAKLFQRLNENFSLWFLGHGAGYTLAMKGNNEIKRAKKWSGALTPEAKEFRETGCSVLGQPYEEGLIKDIQKEWEKLMADDSIAMWQNEYCQQVSMPGDNLPIIKNLITEDILDHFRAYYGTHAKISSALCWRIYGVPDKNRAQYMYSNWWHFDFASTAISKIFIAVNDVTEKDGPFHIYSRQASKELVKKGYSSRYDYGGAQDVIENHEGLYKMIGPAGSAAICNTEYCLHKAGVPYEGHYRDMIQFQLLPSEQEFSADSDWLGSLKAKGVDNESFRAKRLAA